MSKKKNEVKISFLGEATNCVTGSNILIEWKKTKILLECGLHQSNRLENDFMINSKNLPFKSSEIYAIFSMHNHIDHIGKISVVYKNNSNARLIAPDKTREVMKILLEDSAHISLKDAEYLSKTRNKKYKPIYEKEDVEKTMRKLEEYEIDTIHELTKDISFRFTPSQHIIGACQLELFFYEDNGNCKKLVYTSDLGNTSVGKKPYTWDFKPIENTDVFIGECTYSSPKRSNGKKAREKDIQKLESVIRQFCGENKKKVLIPVFAQDRCQLMLKLIYDIFKDEKNLDFDVVIDSPMAIKVTREYINLLEGQEKKEYEKMLDWSRLKLVEEWKDSQLYIKEDKPMVVLSASGMLSAGRVISHFASIIEDEKSCIMTCGFSSPGTLASVIKEGKKKYIEVNGENYRNKVQLVQLKSLSSHMQYNELLSYYSNINGCKDLYLVHGNNDKYLFAQELQKRLKDKCKSTKVWIPIKNDVIKF